MRILTNLRKKIIWNLESIFFLIPKKIQKKTVNLQKPEKFVENSGKLWKNVNESFEKSKSKYSRFCLKFQKIISEKFKEVPRN